MPYYRWKGVDLTATIKKGTLFARSEHELDSLLLQRDIALLRCSVARWYFSRAITLEHICTFFEQLSALLKVGIPLPQALQLIGQRTDHATFGLMIQEMGDAVAQGISFTHAMELHPAHFNALFRATIATGLETGNICQSLDVLTDYLKQRIAIAKQIRAALLMPLVTLGFFLVIAAVLMLVLVPRFAHLLQSVHKELPPLTRTMLTISSFLTGIKGMMVTVVIGILGWGAYRLRTRIISKEKRDAILLSIPFIKSCIYDAQTAAYFQTLGILVSGGMHLVPALQLAQKAVNNEILQAHFNAVSCDVSCGYQLSQAFAAHTQFVSAEALSLISIGEETGALGTIFTGIGQQLYAQLYRRLNRMGSLVQPAMMIILGLLITTLIVAMYTPVFNLSYAV